MICYTTFMQTPAERHLIEQLTGFCAARPQPLRLLNIGSGTSTVIEEQLASAAISFTADRVDPYGCAAAGPFVGACFVAPAEHMDGVQSMSYDAAFSNFVFEHLTDARAAIAEAARVLRPGAIFVLTLSNPQAPEFALSRHTPLWFHQLFKAAEEPHAHEAHYAYRSIDTLIDVFEANGFVLMDREQRSFTYGYLHRIPVIGVLGRLYDYAADAFGWKRLQGSVCLTFRRPV